MDTLAYARTAYLDDEIDVHEFEEAVEHVLQGGLGSARFPYLPVFPDPEFKGIRTSGEWR